MSDEFEGKVAPRRFLHRAVSEGRQPEIVEVSGHAGLDFVLLDMEHGPLATRRSSTWCLAAEQVNIAPIVRVEAITDRPSCGRWTRGRPASWCPTSTRGRWPATSCVPRFGPVGERAWTCTPARPTTAHAEKGVHAAGQQAAVLLQIEGSEGLRNLGEILAVPGSDVIFVGPYDLSQSLGMPGEIDHPEVVARIEGIVVTVRKSGRFVGIYADNVEAARKWIAVGVQFIALSVDTAIYYQGASSSSWRCGSSVKTCSRFARRSQASARRVGSSRRRRPTRPR